MHITHAFIRWVPLAVAVTLVCGLIYAAVQQNYRQSFNDQQVELADSGAALLAAGAQPSEIVPKYSIDITKSLSPFIAIYDSTGNPIASSGKIGDAMPQPPKGVFDAARKNGENRVTWQTDGGTRIALIVKPAIGAQVGYVASGRNMREMEAHVDTLMRMVVIGWMVSLGATLIFSFLAEFIIIRSLRRPPESLISS